MADFDLAQTFVHRAEGGFQADPRDGGNYTGGRVGQGALVGTRYGISAPVLARYLGREITRADMEGLPYGTALQIYRSLYWNPLELDRLSDQALALLLYDGAVNQGPRVARQALAHALATVDAGPINSRTTNAELVRLANGQDAARLHELVWHYRLGRYPKSSPFYRGWLNRLEQLRRR